MVSFSLADWLKLISKTNPIGLQRCTKSYFPIIIFHLVNLNLYEKPQKSILSFISVNLCSMACMSWMFNGIHFCFSPSLCACLI